MEGLESPLGDLSMSPRRSLPDPSTRDYDDEYDKLKSKIEELTSKLESAHTEIENLHMENNTLQRKIHEQENRIQQLTKICSPIPSTKKRKSKLNESSLRRQNKSLDESIMQTGDFQENLMQKNKEKTEEISLKQNIMSPKINSVPNDVNKIHIFGGQQCVGLASALIRSRLNSRHEKYCVTAMTKPNASTEEILSGCENIVFSPKDKIVVNVGENDCNPTRITSELSAFLKKNKDSNVIVMNVVKNKFLNEKLLNNNIRLICNNFNNCNFIEFDDAKRHIDICTKLNYIIDCLDYNEKFLSYNKHSFIHESINKAKARKTTQKTILDYFSCIHKHSKKENYTTQIRTSQMTSDKVSKRVNFFRL